MKSPFQDEEERPTLRRCITLYLDILGFKSTIYASSDRTEAVTALRYLRAALDKAYECLRGSIEEGATYERWYVKAFTDNLVIVLPVSNDELIDAGRLSAHVGRFQLSLACNGFFTRGGMAIGDAYIDDKVVFGGAVVEAYLAEARQAREARVVLAPSMRDLFDLHATFYINADSVPWHLRRDVDGEVFLDYLHYTEVSENGEVPIGLESHRDQIAKGLRDHVSRPTVQQKYFWLAKYHNAFCRQEFRQEPFLLVDLSPALIGPGGT